MHLYIHIPFCVRRCSYCDFAIAVRREVPSDGYVDAVLAEWSMWRTDRDLPSSDSIATLYLGGGTPSLLEPEALQRLIAGLTDQVPLEADAEVTLEANPDDVTAERAARWVAAGVTRVSIGAQSFSPQALEWMHRSHSPGQIGQAVTLARDAGIGEVSLDLIYGLPPGVPRDWSADLERLLSLAPTHVSIYGLTLERPTPLSKWVERGSVVLAGDEHHAAQYLEAHRELVAAGFQHYEVSNAGLPGHYARHNTAYWHRAPYIGLGPSAHSAWGRHRQWNKRDWSAWRDSVASGTLPVAGVEDLADAQVRLEELYLGLRTADGVERAAVPESVLTRWLDRRWAVATESRVRLRPEGWLRLDALVGEAAERG